MTGEWVTDGRNWWWFDRSTWEAAMCGGYAGNPGTTEPFLKKESTGALDPQEWAEQERAFGANKAAAEDAYVAAIGEEARQRNRVVNYWRRRAEQVRELLPFGEFDEFVRWVAHSDDALKTYEEDSVIAVQQYLKIRVTELIERNDWQSDRLKEISASLSIKQGTIARLEEQLRAVKSVFIELAEVGFQAASTLDV